MSSHRGKALLLGGGAVAALAVGTLIIAPAGGGTKPAAFAKEKKLAWLSMWSAARDRQCAGGAKTNADPTCSSIVQNDLAFTKALSS